MNFYKTPFLYIVILLILGIELQSTYQFDFYSISLLLFPILVLVGIWNRFELKENVLSSLFGAAFILSGCLLMSTKQSFKSSSNENSFLVHVTETSSNDKVWKKTIGYKRGTIYQDSIAYCKEPILLYFESDKVEVGDWLVVSSNLLDIKNKNNPGEFDSERYWRLKGIEKMTFVGEGQFLYMDNDGDSWWDEKFEGARGYFSNVLSNHLENEELGVAKALMLGDKGALTKELKTSFGKAGAMHVLAVSGLHVGIILAILMFVFKQFPQRISKRNALLFSLLIIWIYAGITGFSPSVLRATIMFSLISLSVVFGRKNNSINALFFSAFLMMVWDPLIIYDIGFQLSYLAMIGIFSFYSTFSKLFQFQNKWVQKIWDGTAIGIAVQMTTFPVVLYYFHQFPNYFALTNVGMMVFAGLILGIGLLLFSVQWISVLGKVVGVVFLLSLTSMIYFVEFIENLPGSIALGFVLRPETVIFLYLLLLLFYFFRKIKVILWTTVVISFATFISLQMTRFDNLNKSELVFFNSNGIVLGMKYRNKILCFYEERNNGLKNAMYLVESYGKIKPGEVEYKKFKKGITTVEVNQEVIEMNYSKNGLHIEVNEFPITLRSSYKMPYEKEDLVLDSPFLMNNPNNYNLLNGAFTLELKLKP